MPVEGRGLGSGLTQDAARDGRLGDLATPPSVQKLQMALHAKAKSEPTFRFYALYDKIHRADVLSQAYARCRANRGAPGIDGQTFEQVEAYGVERWLGELANSLREETYRPDPIKRVYIPKSNGKRRPLGISTVRDRVCMTATLLVLGPIFEADLPDELYAYRAGKSAQQAAMNVKTTLYRGHMEVVDADLSDYFGSLPHAELMQSLARRIVDRRVLHLIKMWLECAVEEEDGQGRRRRTTEARDSGRGIPQGAPISPLLANLYMRRLVLGWKRRGLDRRLDARLVTYADDLVILCRRGGADEALAELRRLTRDLKLTVNEEKTRICRVPDETFDFLGFTFGRLYQPTGGKAYMGLRPSRKSVRRMVESVHTLTRKVSVARDTALLVRDLNRALRGWANYFSVGSARHAFRALDQYTVMRLSRWLRSKHKNRRRGVGGYPSAYLYEQLGLVRLTALPRGSAWANA
jgi:RNA-directed DNA polymerase